MSCLVSSYLRPLLRKHRKLLGGFGGAQSILEGFPGCRGRGFVDRRWTGGWIFGIYQASTSPYLSGASLITYSESKRFPRSSFFLAEEGERPCSFFF